MKRSDPPRCATAGLVRATVRGGSMRPWLSGGTEVLIRPSHETAGCRAGDIVLVRLGGMWVVHRALRSVPPRARRGGTGGGPVPPTRGDWSGVADATAGAVVGRVVFARSGGRWRRVDTRVARLTGLATGAVIAVVTRIGARGLAADLRGKPRRSR